MKISRERLKYRVIESNGIKMHLAEQGDGPWWYYAMASPNYGILGPTKRFCL
jgi:hypothetical protein